jgi:hypothetical protein
MTLPRLFPWLAISVLVVAAAAVGGYALGAADAPTMEESEQAELQAFTEARRGAFETAFERLRQRGHTSGLEEGQSQGQAAGARRGTGAGEAAAQAELTEIAAAEAEAERQAALAEAQERIENCGAPLFVDGYCPTDEEIELESQAESLCGPGTAEGAAEAAELGITCRVPR